MEKEKYKCGMCQEVFEKGWSDEESRAEARTAALEEALEIIKRHWTFNDYQRHTHSWHDKQDAIGAISSLLTK